MKINLKKKIMLAILAGGMLCANGAMADSYRIWYGEGDNAITWKGTQTDNYTGACTTGANLVLDGKGSCTEGSHEIPFSVVKYFYGGYSGTGDVTNNKVTINKGTYKIRVLCRKITKIPSKYWSRYVLLFPKKELNKSSWQKR